MSALEIQEVHEPQQGVRAFLIRVREDAKAFRGGCAPCRSSWGDGIWSFISRALTKPKSSAPAMTAGDAQQFTERFKDIP